jgi:glycosyltransferase involved in cell wall biosynthesis
MNTVDVVVPCYNYARYLRRCVGSILDQRDVSTRVLILDDASSDDSAEVGRELAAGDRRVEFRRHQVNQGHIATYNEGLLGWASAEYSLLLSADDALTPGALGRAVGLMNSHPDVGLTYGMALVVGDDTGWELPDDPAAGSHHIMSGPEFLEHCCQFANPVATPTAVLRTALQQRIGGYRADLPHSGDMEMWMRCATQGSVGVLRAVQAFYRWHGRNMGTAYYEAILGDLQEQKAACTEVLTAWGSHIARVDRLLELADRRIGERAFWMASKAFDAGDDERSRACLQFAEQHYPRLRQSPKWWRFQAKKIVGRSIWRRVEPLVHPARGAATAAAPAPAGNFQMGELTGWWPSSGPSAPEAR